MHNDLARHDVSFAESPAAGLLHVVVNISAALYRPGVERQVFLAANFLIKPVENARGLEDCTSTNVVAENSRRVRLLTSNLQSPATRTAPGDRGPVGIIKINRRLKTQGDIRPLASFYQVLPGDRSWYSGFFFIAGINDDDRNVFKCANLTQSLQGIDDRYVARLHIVNSGPVARVTLASE